MKSNLLDQRKSNIERNVGEIDVRHSINSTIKTMDYNSVRDSYRESKSINRSLSNQRVAPTPLNEPSVPGRGSLRIQGGRSLTQHYDRFIANSPSSRFLFMSMLFRPREKNNEDESSLPKEICNSI